MMSNPTQYEHVPEDTIPELRTALMKWRVWGIVNALRSIAPEVPTDEELQPALSDDVVEARTWRAWALRKLRIPEGNAAAQAVSNHELRKMLDALLGP